MQYLRFVLVLAVIHSHTWIPGMQGFSAVFIFYIISAFLITRMVNEIYSPSIMGHFLFLKNRFVRIYPTFWLCMLASLFCLYITDQRMLPFLPRVTTPNSIGEWLNNLSIIGTTSLLNGRNSEIIVPGSTTLAIEIVFYLIVGMVTGRSKRLTWLGLLASSSFVCYKLYHGTSFEFLYFSILGTAPLFFLGSLSYFYRGLCDKIYLLNRWVAIIIACIATSLPVLFNVQHYPLWEQFALLYTISLVGAYCVICLYKHSTITIASPVEQFLAGISYPMFLLHFPLIGTAIAISGGAFNYGLETFVAAVILSFVFGSLVVLFVDRPLSNVRKKIRNRAMLNHAVD